MLTTIKYFLNGFWHFATFEYENEARNFITTCKASDVEYQVFDTVERKYRAIEKEIY